jgi:hypothetical protein
MYRVGLIRVRSDGRYYNENRSHEARNEGHGAHLEKSAECAGRWMMRVSRVPIYSDMYKKGEMCGNATRLFEFIDRLRHAPDASKNVIK